jgi:hypothetical protein
MSWSAILHHCPGYNWFSFATIRNGLPYFLIRAMVGNFYPYGWLGAGEDANAFSQAFGPTGRAGLSPGER